MDHTLNGTTSILRFIEQNWNLGSLGDPQPFDVLASGTIPGMFDFSKGPQKDGRVLYLDPSAGERIGDEW